MEHPSIVAGKSVLEIGSGCGLCGIVAAKLGASRVKLMYMCNTRLQHSGRPSSVLQMSILCLCNFLSMACEENLQSCGSSCNIGLILCAP